MQKIITRAQWHPSSYRNFRSHLEYFSPQLSVFKKLNALPPIVSIQKIMTAKQKITNCQNHLSSFLHIGDCAQPFQHAHPTVLQSKIKFIKDCGQALSQVKGKNATVIGRIAGQYAKPRSSQFVQINGNKIHNYKGDNVNSLDESDRNPCQKKLLQGYHHSLSSAKTIQGNHQLFCSHQGLILPYQQSLTKEKDGKFLCQSAHMLWIGQRTRQLNGAHVQFFRGIQNPIGVKVSSNINQKQFLQLVKTLNPNNQKGKLIVIVRMGKQKIKHMLNSLISIKKNEGLNFLFVTDPMHGNTFDSKQAKVKTRSLPHILQQIKYFQQRMKDNGLNYGYSLEATFEDVTECYGLEYPLIEKQINKQKYKSKCDPRLNRNQTLKLVSMLDS